MKEKKLKKVTIYDVAREAQVSPATVSRVINNKNIVSEEKKKRIFNAIKKLKYHPSLVARSMRTKITGYVGFILPNITIPFYPRVIEGSEDFLYKKNYNLIIANVGNDIYKLRNQLELLTNRNVSGILYCSLGFTKDEKEVLEDFIENSNTPIVFVDRIIPETKHSYVINDNFLGAYIATDYLIKLGHNKIALIYSGFDIYTSRIRYNGYIEALHDNAINFDDSLIFVADDISLKSGYLMARKIFNSKNKPDAIFCLSDILAIGVLKYIYENKLNVPEDVSIMGYDDIEFSSISSPPLTTIHQIKYKMGYEAAKFLINDIINKKRKKPKKIILKPYLVERETTRKIL